MNNTKLTVGQENFSPIKSVIDATIPQEVKSLLAPTPNLDFIHSPEFFDDRCIAELSKLSPTTQMCIKERYEQWQILFGFIQAHLNWFEEIKNSPNKWIAGLEIYK